MSKQQEVLEKLLGWAQLDQEDKEVIYEAETFTGIGGDEKTLLHEIVTLENGINIMEVWQSLDLSRMSKAINAYDASLLTPLELFVREVGSQDDVGKYKQLICDMVEQIDYGHIQSILTQTKDYRAQPIADVIKECPNEAGIDLGSIVMAGIAAGIGASSFH